MGEKQGTGEIEVMEETKNKVSDNDNDMTRPFPEYENPAARMAASVGQCRPIQSNLVKCTAEILA